MSLVVKGMGDSNTVITKGLDSGIFIREVIRLKSWLRRIYNYISKID